MSRLEGKVERLTDQLGSKERELQALTSKEQKAAAAHKAQLERLQHEKDEFQRMVISTQVLHIDWYDTIYYICGHNQINHFLYCGHGLDCLQQVRIQQTHELKKKEKEFIKLQERLIQVLQEKKKESKTGMEIMNLLQKEGRQRGTWLNKKADGDFYKMIVSSHLIPWDIEPTQSFAMFHNSVSVQVDAYEAQKQELIAENTDLRNMLRSMQACILQNLSFPEIHQS
jgi:X breakpoint 2-interacting protein